MKNQRNIEHQDIVVGPLTYSHNRFLAAIACVAIALYVVASLNGTQSQEGSLWALAMAPQMLWAYSLIPLAWISAVALSRAGYKSTAKSCFVVAGSFFVGAAAFTFTTF